MHPTDTFNDRVWLAWHSLPRGRTGRPPAYAKLERRADGTQRVAYATISKIMTGERKSVDPDTLFELAEIFGVSAEWLQTGKGTAPTPTGPVPPRAAEEKYAAYDPATWADLVELGGGVTIMLPSRAGAAYVAPRNNFEVAVHAMYPDVSIEAIKRVAARARGKENERPAHHWGVELRDEEKLVRADAKKPVPRTERPPQKEERKRRAS